ncbi:TIGR03016 family PEP-CTERM system-associated outer membrane protein [Thalassotalea mangrovi]|uniref:TIGR03016 family PEP-CTERM system-associated outer membrane protein n=1 Tax=Thalassotalea mangrovi TaxID=2572245 RepID=A0A4U1B7N3_9GAMM|nr:TIGR03016 family PEP-CTERM system-associated outer membrane protein [Thalassotalea mangrovi]TKB46620.1 TIGR03016 family PEP-CTERM system-associated outer membrane protein [Thalassotalea mangrovi]
MVITVTDTIIRLFNKISVLAICTVLTFSSQAEPWNLTPRVSVEEVVTDNVELSPTDETISFVTLISPGINAQYVSGGALADIDYEFIQVLYSHDLGERDNFNQMEAMGRIELWPEGMAAFATYSIDNVAENSARNALADLVAGNTVQFQRFRAGLEYNVTSSSVTTSAQLAYLYDTAQDAIGDREGYSGFFNTRSGNAARNIFWDASGQILDTSNNRRSGQYWNADIVIGWITGFKLNPFVRFYDEDTEGNLLDTQIQGTSSFGFGIRWQIIDSLDVDLAWNQVDEDSANQPDVDFLAPPEDYISGAINWQPSARTLLRAKFFQRFYGDAYQASFRHRMRKLTTTLAYNEAIELFDRYNFVDQQLEVWCLGLTPGDFSSCIVGPNESFDLTGYTFVGFASDVGLRQSETYSLNKTLNFSTSLALKRTTYHLGIRKTKRTELEFGDDDIYEYFNIGASREVTRNATVDASFSYIKNDFDRDFDEAEAQIDHYRIWAAEWNEELNSTLTLTIYGQHLNRNSNRFLLNYNENRIGIELVKEF